MTEVTRLTSKEFRLAYFNKIEEEYISKQPKNSQKNLSNIMNRVLSESTDQELVAFMKDGSFPPIKLSNQELELVKGGFWQAVAAGCLYLAAHTSWKITHNEDGSNSLEVGVDVGFGIKVGGRVTY